MAKKPSAEAVTVSEAQPTSPAATPAAPATPAQQDSPPAAQPTVEDPDDVALRELMAAEGNPEPTSQPTPDPAKPAATAPATTTQPAATASPGTAEPVQEPTQQTVMVPKARLDEEIRHRRDVETENARLRGLAEGLVLRSPQAQQPGAPTAQPKPKDPATRISEIRAEKEKLAEAYDNGEISMAELTRKQGALDDEIVEVRSAAQRPAPQPVHDQQPAGPGGDSIVVEERTVAMEAAHPYTLHIPQDTPEGQARWTFIQDEATVQLEAQGVVFHPDRNGTLPDKEKLVLRTRMAELTDKYGPIWVGPLPAQQPQQAPAAGQTPLSRTAQARAQKLDLAEQHPIDVSQMGNSANATDIAAIAARVPHMTEAELEAMDPKVLDRILTNPG